MDNSKDGIVLLAKQPGPTSFSCLFDVKHALNTTKAGHTGTLDSFAQGLLVVCTGRLTRLAGNIIELDKSYEAIIKFGEETDTLEPLGNVILQKKLPSLENLKSAVQKYTCTYNQKPPVFSSIHIDGKRASDLVRQGSEIEMKSRSVTVYSAEIIDVKLNSDNLVEYAKIEFSVSKGTYIRSLARDIAYECDSAAHLVGLYRTRIGNFYIQDAAGYSRLEEFTFENALKNANASLSLKNQDSEEIQKEIISKKQTFTKESAVLCGFYNMNLLSEEFADNFRNGRPIKNRYFDVDLYKIPVDTICSVFYMEEFCGLLYKNNEGRISYKFVIN